MRRMLYLAAVSLLATLGALAAQAGTVVYDNTENDLQSWNPIYQQSGGGIYSALGGDDVTLGPGGRYVDKIEILAFQSFYEGSGTVDARVRFFAPDGASGGPGTLLWDSGVVAGLPYHGLSNVFGFDVPLVLVPDTFIWTIEFSNVITSSAFNFGLMNYGPPVYGSTAPGGWYRVDDAWQSWGLDHGARISATTEISVDIDIKPATMPNTIQLKGKGNVLVAILSTSTFHSPTEVHMSSLTFGRSGTEPSLFKCNALPEDVNGDGLLDLICQFRTELTDFQLGDTLGVLMGETIGGTKIQGTDSIRIRSK